MERDAGPIHLDSNVIIHMVEGFPSHRAGIERLLEMLENGLRAVTSELTLAEVLVKPIEQGWKELADRYEDLMAGTEELTVRPVSRAVLAASARLRARLGGKLPDAIHVATAMANGCTMFVTEDNGIRLPETLTRKRLGDFAGQLP